VGAILAGIYLALQLLWTARSVLLLTFLAVLFGLCLSAAVDYLARWRIPRAAGAALIMLALLGSFTGLGAIVAPRITQQMGELQRQLPDAVQQVEQWVESRYRGVIETIQDTVPGPAAEGAQPKTEAGGRPEPATSIRKGLAEQVAGLGSHFFDVFSSTLSVLAGLILIVFVMIYIAADPGLYHRGVMHLFPHATRSRAGEVLSEVATMLRRWLLTQVVAMLVIGSVTTVVLLLLDVPAAVALGIIAGLLEFVPYVGPILSAVPAIAMGFLSGPQVALAVAVAYIVIQQAENHLLIPLLMKRGLDLPPVVTIVSQAVMGIIFGILGLLVAMPLVASVMVMIKMLYVEDVVGDEVSLPSEA
jgi:predicted PurR-regulated permease PerM